MKLIMLLLSLMFIDSCAKPNDKLNEININMKKKTYYLYYNIQGNYEIFCNGISLSEYSYNDGSVTASEYLNPLISEKGEQTISIKINKYDDTNLSPEYLKGIKLSLYYSENGDDGNIVLVKDFTLKPVKENQPMIFETWSFKADVDYQIPNPLEYAGDLTKEDFNNLKEDVLNKYNEIFSIINSGDAEKYSELYESSFTRETLSMYLDSTETKNYINNLKNRVISSKNQMKSFGDFKININPNKKIIELTSKEGKPLLQSVDEKGKIKFFALQLYRSTKTGELEVY